MDKPEPQKTKKLGRPKSDANEIPVRELIVRTALQKFCDQGYDGANIEEIARAANVVKPTVHYHYKSKLALWKAAVDMAFKDMEQTRQNLDQELDGLDPLARLKLGLRSYIRYTLRTPEHIRLLHLEGMGNTERSQWLIDQHVRPLHLSMKTHIETLQDAGAVKPLSPLVIDSVIGGSLVALVTNIATIGSIYDVTAMTEETVLNQANEIMEVIFSGILADKPKG